MGRRYGNRGRDFGFERAMQHIHEAEELSRELGGTDKDVKQYFFGLSPVELKPILEEYEGEFGKDKRQYAENTIEAWRTGKRKMSGLVAARLFKLLPKRMPLSQKYALVETLWAKHAPQSEYSVSFGHNSAQAEIRGAIEKHMALTVNAHTIPEAMQRRFGWLAAGDTQIMQDLLNHFLIRDRQAAVEAVCAQVAILLKAETDQSAVQGFKRELKVGGHTINVFLDPRITEVKLAVGPPQLKSAPDYSWIGCLIGIVFIIAIILLAT